jgi:hypothetical protein
MRRFPKFQKIDELMTRITQARNDGEAKAACENFQEAIFSHYGLDNWENIKKGSWKAPHTAARKAVSAINPDYLQYLSQSWHQRDFPDEARKEETEGQSPALESYKRVQDYLQTESEEIQEMVTAALDFSGMSEDEFIRKAIVSYARNFKPHAQAQVEEMVTSELIGSKIKGSSEELTRRAIDAIIQYNLNQPERENRYQITVTGIKALTGCRHETIKQVIEEQETKIHDHHEHHVSHSRVWNRGKPDIRTKVIGFKHAD